MNRRMNLIIMAAVVTLGSAFETATLRAQEQATKLLSGKEVLQRYVEMTGGIEAYKAVRSSRSTGKLLMPAQGINGTLEVTTVTPNKLVALVKLEGLGQHKQVSNGEHCWENSTMNGLRIVGSDEAKQIAQQSDMERIYRPEKFFQSMENNGIEDVDGKVCYKIALTSTEGKRSTKYYDVNSGFEVKSIQEQKTPVGDLKVETYLSNYKSFGGITMATKMEQKFSNGMTQVIMLDSVEYNVDIPESLFAVPQDVKKLISKSESKAKT